VRDSDSSTQGACEAAKSSGVRHDQINTVDAKETYQLLRYPAGRVSHLIHGWRCDAMRREREMEQFEGERGQLASPALGTALNYFRQKTPNCFG
jgi:hypothetical protein